ncbi:hypothetical protein ACFSR7_11870 [Cohnella sp. GCM10020058]|uniref:hypothetical protein n=1 Tax=Cohnella sp. GCM10020058 TaxID=3317330 RepID=UPI003640101B
MKPSAFLQMGPLQAVFEEGGLRAIAYGGTEIVRGLYAAVRDRNWGTVAPRITDVRSTKSADEWTLRFVSRHTHGEIDFEWTGVVALRPDRLRFDFDGVAHTTFLKNRIGFCVLHPMSFAGLPAAIRTKEGIVNGAFPSAIAPHQPYKAMQGIAYEPAPGLRVSMAFDGDSFEMEDQRNWTDASYKTYCTPLDLPFPVRLEAGQRLTQSVLIRIAGDAAADGGNLERATGWRADAAESLRQERPADGADSGAGAAPGTTVRIEVDQAVVCPLPAIGLALSEDEPAAHAAEWLDRLRPAHLHVSLDLGEDGWRSRLEAAAAAAAGYGCGLALELLLDATRERLPALVRLIAGSGGGRTLPVIRVLPYAAGAFVSDADTLREVREALLAVGLTPPVGGGTRAYYAEFNRAALPLAELELAAYTINPQVHAFDDRSLMETPAAQRATAMDAAAKSGKPLYVGPITFKPRLNPNATSGGGAVPLADRTDARQHAPFGAAWTLGSVSALCVPAVRGLTYFETAGPLGLVCGGKPSSLYFVMRDLMETPGAGVLSVGRSSEDVAVLALRTGEGCMRMLLANTTPAPRAVEIDAGGAYGCRTVTSYDDFDRRERPAATVEAMPVRPADASDRAIRSILAPYACLRLDFEKDFDTDTKEGR